MREDVIIDFLINGMTIVVILITQGQVGSESTPRIRQLGPKDSPNHTQESHETRSNLTCEAF
ncbi:hypothetical protein J6590_024331 [Homalodisca vitripennis]|nr:hypothetical protein J6590_024331 [Homalodisca vitripennis]